jgi:hypothetical protein
MLTYSGQLERAKETFNVHKAALSMELVDRKEKYSV